jgi:molecular chaperone DnaK (HSP70)
MEGTDAKVFINLMYKNKSSGNIFLNNTNSKSREKNNNLFEAGSIDEFLVKTKEEISKIDKIKIGHDNSGFAPGWHLNRVEVLNKNSGLNYLFKCNEWLSATESDFQTERILFPLSENRESNDTINKLFIKVKHKEDEIDDEIQVKNNKQELESKDERRQKKPKSKSARQDSKEQKTKQSSSKQEPPKAISSYKKQTSEESETDSKFRIV